MMKRRRKSGRIALIAVMLFALLFPVAMVVNEQEAAATAYTVQVNLNSVVQSDYLGVGVNVIPNDSCSAFAACQRGLRVTGYDRLRDRTDSGRSPHALALPATQAI